MISKPVSYFIHSYYMLTNCKCEIKEDAKWKELFSSIKIEKKNYFDLYLDFLVFLKRSENKDKYSDIKLNPFDFVNSFENIVSRVLEVELKNKFSITTHLEEMPYDILKRFFDGYVDFRNYDEWDTGLIEDLEHELTNSDILPTFIYSHFQISGEGLLKDILNDCVYCIIDGYLYILYEDYGNNYTFNFSKVEEFKKLLPNMA